MGSLVSIKFCLAKFLGFLNDSGLSQIVCVCFTISHLLTRSSEVQIVQERASMLTLCVRRSFSPFLWKKKKKKKGDM